MVPEFPRVTGRLTISKITFSPTVEQGCVINNSFPGKQSCCLVFPQKCTKPSPLSSACIVKIHNQEVRNLVQIQLSQKQKDSISPLSKDTSVCVCVKNEALFFMFYFRSSIFYIFLELHDLPDAYTLQAATTLNSSKRGMKMKNKK